MGDEYQNRRDIDKIYDDLYSQINGSLNVLKFKEGSQYKNISSEEGDIGTIDAIIDYYGLTEKSSGDLSDYYTKEEITTILSSYVTSQTLEDYQPLLESGVNIKTINNESLLGEGNINISSQNVFYGTCDTTGTTQIKVVTVDDWSFDTGNILFVKFDDYNKYNGTAKISIDGVEKDIATVGTTKTSRYYWKTGEVVGFVYDGTNMVLLEGGTATTTYYGITKLSSSTSSTSETLSATPKAVKTAYDLANGKADEVHTHTVSDVTDFPSIPSKTSDLTNDGEDGSNPFVSDDDSRLSDARTPTAHSHSTLDVSNSYQYSYIGSNLFSQKLINDGINIKLRDIGESIPSKTSDLTNDGEDGTNVFVSNNDSRLSNARTPTTHSHGNISNDGKINGAKDGAILHITDDNGTIGATLYLNANKVKDSNAHSNIGTSSSEGQDVINTAIDTALSNKANSVHTHDDRYYTESETDNLLNGKASSSHTHDDRYYTESETDTLLSSKAPSTHTHDESEITLEADHYNINTSPFPPDVYAETQDELNNYLYNKANIDVPHTVAEIFTHIDTYYDYYQ